MKPPILGGEKRLEMMGGEFCGNAARSFGRYIAKKKHCKEAVIEISGSKKPMTIAVQENGWAKAYMPLPQELRTLTAGDAHYPMVCLDGISHVIVENETPKEEQINKILQAVQKDSNPEAAGVLYLNRKSGSMVPIVWVRELDSLVWENSCGSGSVAAATFLTRDKADGSYRMLLHQPKGDIEVELLKEWGKISSVSINGLVRITEEMEIEI